MRVWNYAQLENLKRRFEKIGWHRLSRHAQLWAKLRKAELDLASANSMLFHREREHRNDCEEINRLTREIKRLQKERTPRAVAADRLINDMEQVLASVGRGTLNAYEFKSWSGELRAYRAEHCR